MTKAQEDFEKRMKKEIEEWKESETAPKDGSTFIGAKCHDWHGWKYEIVTWDVDKWLPRDFQDFTHWKNIAAPD